TTTSVQCFTQYTPLGVEFQNILKKHWHIINSDPLLLNIFNNPPRIVFKRAPNLRDMLVKSDLPPPKQKTFLSDVKGGHYKCGKCAQCNFTYKCNSFNHPHSGTMIKIQSIISCSTADVIYLLRCPCGLAYIGKTIRSLKTSISEHRSNIRTRDVRSPVAAHFMQVNHNVSSLQYIGMEKVRVPRRGGNINRLLLQTECYWIYRLNTLSPKGLNEEFDIRPFLGAFVPLA
ncbi:uncharacterized protein LOC118217183, partial [Anguilla anguilla]|uniref:uncharacterized protein LOC118217183 n=1 Tax=Anguilla anguilla TaxID=7936 RepID=UPI0015B1E566